MADQYRYQDPYDEIPSLGTWPLPHSWTDQELLAKLLEWLPARPWRAVDVGAGDGRLLAALAGMADEIVLVEPDRSRLSRARARAQELSVTQAAFVEQDVATFAATQVGRFDLVLCSHVIPHISRRQRVGLIAGLCRLLGPDGHLLATFPAVARTRSRYLVSQRLAESTAVTTVAVAAARFDELADAASQGVTGPAGLPVWHAPVAQMVRGFERGGLDVCRVVAYRPFRFPLRGAPGAADIWATAVDTGLLATRRREAAG
jgi:ubiquinone/menaquinone biosynthesis C-methylase UbiE